MIMDCDYLPRNIKLDWLRFQVVTYNTNFFRQIRDILGLPFEKKQASLQDARETNVMALNKVWHEVWDFQGSWLGIKYPPTGKDEPFQFFVNLNGSTLDALNFEKISSLLYFAHLDTTFTANRIDIALDFPIQSPRLFAHNWESLIEDGLLYGYRKIRRISNCGSNDGNTVYIGSRESTRFLRIYCKRIGDDEYDRLEGEFKGERANWIMKQLAQISVKEYPEFLNGAVCSQISFTRKHKNVAFFTKYKYGAVNIPTPTLRLDIEKSIRFFEKHAPTFAMLQEFMGPDEFDKFVRINLAAGKLRMNSRHRTILSNAKFFGVGLAIFLLFFGQAPAIAGGLTCPATPAPVSLGSQMVQKFPIDIAIPNAQEQAYLNNIGDGCFQINSGLNFDRICLPGMIVNALKPFVVIGLGIKFIFSD
jgi:hypothetical protein